MAQHPCDEVLDGVTLRQLLSLQPTAGPEAPVWLPDGSGIVTKVAGDGGLAIRRIDAQTGTESVLAEDLGTLPFLSAPRFYPPRPTDAGSPTPATDHPINASGRAG